MTNVAKPFDEADLANVHRTFYQQKKYQSTTLGKFLSDTFGIAWPELAACPRNCEAYAMAKTLVRL